MLHFIISHLSDIFMILCGIFLGAFIIVLEVYLGTRIEKAFSLICCIFFAFWLLTRSFWHL